MNETNNETKLAVVEEDAVEAALVKAQKKIREERTSRIGDLLDTASGVLMEHLESDKRPEDKLYAVQIAIGLYTTQEDNNRQDRRLALQEQQLLLERAKLSQPGGPLYQSNTMIINEAPQTEEEKKIKAEMLLQRKQAQDNLLSSFLPARPKPVEEGVVEIKDEE